MLQPLRLALPLALTLAWGTSAQAQPTERTRVERQRSVPLASTPAEPLPVVRVARDTMTLLFFPSPIQKKTLTFDESRIRVLDTGERSVIIQPVANLGDGERQELGVFFEDGRAPARAAFRLVTDPAEVDSRIDVQRPAPPNEPCQPTAQAPAPKPEDFVRLGYLDDKGISTSRRKGSLEAMQGLSFESLVAFRGTTWILADVTISNSLEQPAWTPREATFVGMSGTPLRARLVAMKPGPIPPGEARHFLAAVEVTATDANLVFTLEVLGEEGRRLTIPGVRFPRPAAGDAR
ncbi:MULTISPECIES: DUF2381 family protein [unclassified Corallococcus]|uniref:DUF2381 family protein n=1 Tax=unclassified Corallococcus TaxID=2685029 RepID=UPI001A8E419C|nr:MULTISPECIES: DUF2381 family protein [unclassified Corallococcus]MBN9680826.1 DUF2381 family protein [Corallococcus sp. NCSPR001]WAS87567.1 DUF2381 family protein [Corallococcus sp. NCRR]